MPESSGPYVERVAQGSLVPSLSADAEMCDQCSIPLYVVVTNVIEQASALTDQHEKTATAVMVLLVDLQVLGEMRDACGEQRNLHLG